MHLTPELTEKLELLANEFGQLNLRSDEVPEAIYGLCEHLIQCGKGRIPIAVSMITTGLAHFLVECQGDATMAVELFEAVASRAKEEIGNV